MRMSFGRISMIVVLIALLSFFFIWPGVCRYEYFCFQRHGATKEYGPNCYRADRLTGKVQFLDVEGWH